DALIPKPPHMLTLGRIRRALGGQHIVGRHAPAGVPAAPRGLALALMRELAHFPSSGQSVQHSRCWSIGRGHATHSATPTSARNTAPKNTQVMADTPPRQPSA